MHAIAAWRSAGRGVHLAQKRKKQDAGNEQLCFGFFLHVFFQSSTVHGRRHFFCLAHHSKPVEPVLQSSCELRAAMGGAADVIAVAAIRPRTNDASAAPATRRLRLAGSFAFVRGADSSGMVLSVAMA